MGCFGSRLDKRASGASESANSVGLQFLGGEGADEWKFSADRFVEIQGDKDLQDLYKTEGGKATDDAAATAAFKETFIFVEKLHKAHTDLCTADPKAKTALVDGKHTRQECIDQL